MNKPCNDHALEELLHDDCNVAEQHDIEQHLETCKACQARLAELAADEQLWTQAASHLSTVNELELPPRLTSRLNETTAFVIPALNEGTAVQSDSNIPAPFYTNTDWTQILDPPSHPEMLGQIDGFEIESKIGHGGMGIVLKGFDRELNRAVAIKVLSPHLAINGTARKRFAREAESAAAVMHANVVPIYSVNKSPTRPYIVMQLVPGHSLQSLVKEKGPLDPKDVVRISMQIAAGLAAAHKQGLIHRDVKPGNILIERDVSRVMITDFGLARAADDAGMTQTGWLAGTPHYMSPEQSKGDELDARTDLFSLGSLMYFIATGREPFRGEKPYAVIQKIISKQQTHPAEANADVPAPLAQVIEKLLEKDPKHRFQSAEEVVHILEDYLAHLQQPTKTKAPKRILTTRQKRQRSWLAGIGLSAALGALIWFGATALNSSPTPKVSNPNSGSTPDSAPSTSSPPIVSSADSPDPKPEVAAEAPSTSSPIVAPFYSDDEFSNELSSVIEDLESLEKSLRSSAPIEFNSQPSSSWPSEPTPAETRNLDSELKNLESSFNKNRSPFAQQESNQAGSSSGQMPSQRIQKPNLNSGQKPDSPTPNTNVTPNPRKDNDN